MADWIQALATQFYEQAARLAPQIAVGLFIFLVFWGAGRIVQVILIKACRRARIDDNLTALISGTLNIVVLIFGGVTALGTMGVNVGALIAGLGLSGFAISFALKDALANLLAGISILLYRPFCVGNYISVTGLEGQVMRIDLRYTVLKAKEAMVLIPNASLFTNSILVFHSKEEMKSQSRLRTF